MIFIVLSWKQSCLMYTFLVDRWSKQVIPYSQFNVVSKGPVKKVFMPILFIFIIFVGRLLMWSFLQNSLFYNLFLIFEMFGLQLGPNLTTSVLDTLLLCREIYDAQFHFLRRNFLFFIFTTNFCSKDLALHRGSVLCQ